MSRAGEPARVPGSADGATVLAVGATEGEARGMGEDGSTSLARAIAVLMVLGSGECTGGEGLGVVQIARLVGKEKTQVSRTLKALAEAGLVIRDAESLRYRLGWRLFTLAATAADQQLLALTPHVLRGLSAAPAPRTWYPEYAGRSSSASPASRGRLQDPPHRAPRRPGLADLTPDLRRHPCAPTLVRAT